MTELQIPNTCNFVANNNTDTGHVWTVQFEGNERATVTATNNPNGSTTYHILEVMHWWTTQQDEVESMLADYAANGNWVQEK